jgi:hypothetical protein
MARPLFRRRDLLLGAGAAALLAPILRATMARAEPEPAKRLVVLLTPNGLNYLDAAPSGPETAFDLGDYYAPLEAHKGDVIALTGMHIGGVPYGSNSETGHRSGGMGCLTCTPDESTGWATGPSIDQLVARKLAEQGLAPYVRAPVFSVGASGTSDYAHSFYETAAVPVPLVDDPLAAFDALFHDLAGGSEEETAQLLARKKSVLDAAWKDCKSFVPDLPSEGRALLEYHCDRIRELEQNLEGLAGLTCTPPTSALATVSALDRNNPDSYPALVDFFWELIEVALVCDATRVVSFSFGDTGARFNMPWVDPPLLSAVDTGETNVKDHHSHTHAGTRESVGLFMNWYAMKIAALFDRLKAPLPDGSRLLDSTIAYWTTEYGAGGAHDNANVPMFVLGSAGGRFQTGRHLAYDNDAAHTHALMVSLIQAMGITGVDQFGHPAGGSGPLAALG